MEEKSSQKKTFRGQDAHLGFQRARGLAHDDEPVSPSIPSRYETEIVLPKKSQKKPKAKDADDSDSPVETPKKKGAKKSAKKGAASHHEQPGGHHKDDKKHHTPKHAQKLGHHPTHLTVPTHSGVSKLLHNQEGFKHHHEHGSHSKQSLKKKLKAYEGPVEFDATASPLFKKKDKKDPHKKAPGTAGQKKGDEKRETKKQAKLDKKEKKLLARLHKDFDEPSHPQFGGSKKKKEYPSYITKSEADHGIMDGTLFEGTLRVNNRNGMVAFVDVPGLIRGFKVDGLKDRNRAMDKDKVVIAVHPKSKWIQSHHNFSDVETPHKGLIDLRTAFEGPNSHSSEDESDVDAEPQYPKVQQDSSLDVPPPSADEASEHNVAENKKADDPKESSEEESDGDDENEDEDGDEDEDDLSDEDDASELDEFDDGLEDGDDASEESDEHEETEDEEVDDAIQDDEVAMMHDESSIMNSSHPTAITDDETIDTDASDSGATNEDVSDKQGIESTSHHPTSKTSTVRLIPSSAIELYRNLSESVANDVILWKPRSKYPFPPKTAVPPKVSIQAPKSTKKQKASNATKAPVKNPKKDLPGKSSASALLQNSWKFTNEDFQDGLIPTAYVVYVSEKAPPARAVGHFISSVTPGVKKDKKSKSNISFLVPRDPRIPRVLVDTSKVPQSEIEGLELFKVKITDWPETSKYPLGVILEKIGRSGDIESETALIEYQYAIEDVPFSEKVLECLPKTDGLDWPIPTEEVQNRDDLRSWRIFSIDPSTARDLDDALSVEYLGDDTYRVGVHIADVSYFVKPNTALDKEAFERSTSVYFVQKVIPMLPRLLCEQLCSLNAGVDRLAFTAELIMNSKAEILRERFYRSIIRSCAKLTYDHAQDMIQGGEGCKTDPTVSIKNGHTLQQVTNDVQTLHKLAQLLRARRFHHGAIRLTKSRMNFKLDQNGEPVEVRPYIMRESNQLVEEFMVLANIRVAKRISAVFPDQALLRMHPRPKLEGIKQIVDICRSMGYNFPSKPEDFSKALSSIQGHSEPIAKLLSHISIRAMLLAKYFCTGNLPEDEWAHYGLSVSHYTHFTSPIRRYPDLIVHRLLDAAIRLGFGSGENIRPATHTPVDISKYIPDGTQCSQIAENANDKKYNSRLAQEQSERLFFCLMFRNRLAEEKAIVIDMWEKGFTLLVEKYGYERKMLFTDIPSQSPQFDPKSMKVTYKKVKLVKIEKLSEDPSEKHTYTNITTYANDVITLGLMSEVGVQFTVRQNVSPMDLEYYVIRFYSKSESTSSFLHAAPSLPAPESKPSFEPGDDRPVDD